MRNTIQRFSVATLTLVALLAGGCGDDDLSNAGTTTTGEIGETATSTSTTTGETTGSTGEPVDPFDLNEYILSLGHLEVLPQQDPDELEEKCKEDNENEEDEDCLEDDPDSKFTCEYKYYSGIKNIETLVSTSANLPNLYPGAGLQGKDIQHNLLTPLGALPRADITASVSLPNLQGPVSFTYNPEKLSEYRDGLYKVLSAEIKGQSPTSMSFEMRRVFSFNELSLLLGTNVEWASTEIKNLFEFDSKVSKTRVAVKFTEKFYDVTANAALNPEDYFVLDKIEEEKVKSVMYADNPPMIVRSATYGRTLVFVSEGDVEEQKMKNALSAAFNFVVKGNVDLTVEEKVILDSLSTKAYVIGGNNPAQIISGYEGLISFITDNANGYNEDNPGSIIGYQAAYLDGTGTKLALVTDYAEAICAPKPIPGSRVALANLYLPKNGQAGGKGNCKIRVWAKDTGGAEYDFYNTNGNTEKCGDNQNWWFNSHHDFFVPDPEKGLDYVQVCFEVSEEAKKVKACDQVAFDGKAYPAKSGSIEQQQGNLKAQLNYSFKPLN